METATPFFRRPLVAFALGIGLPAFCVLNAIANGFSSGLPVPGGLVIASYGVMGLSVLALCGWLAFGRYPSVACGVLRAGFAFALLLGIAILPLSLIFLLAVIGILGFAPFLTAATFWSCAKGARAVAGPQFKARRAWLAFVLVFALPIAAQAFVSIVSARAIQQLVDGPSEEANLVLSRLGPLFRTDELVYAYLSARRFSETEERLAGTYRALTGRDVVLRVQALAD